MKKNIYNPQSGDPRLKRPQPAFGEPRSEEKLIEEINETSGYDVFTLKSPRRLEGRIPAENIHSVLSALRNNVGFEHLSAISCVDWINVSEFELVYHLWSYRDNVLVSIKTRIARDPARMATITDLWQTAAFFERDIYEMFGVIFDGNPNWDEKYILTDWEGPPPMRKDFVTRVFAHDHFKFRDYEPDWDELIDGGYHGSRGEGGIDG